MIINNNISAINTRNQLFVTNTAAGKSMEKLSSGKRINRAADDAAGLSISEKMRAQIRGLNQAARNAQDGISLIQTAEGALDEVSNMLVRLKELAVQKANGTYNDKDIENLELEMESLGDEIDNKVPDRRPFRCHVDRAKFCLCLRFEYRLLNAHRDGADNARPDVGCIKIFFEEVAYTFHHPFAKRGQVRSSLRGVLSVDKRIIFFTVLIAVGERHFDVVSLQVNDGIAQLFRGTLLLEQVEQAVF